MSGPEHPDSPPPEVPEEFVDAYREAYRRALESGVDAAPDHAAPDHAAQAMVTPGQDVPLAATRPDEGPAPARRTTRWRDARWLWPVAIGASALVLVTAAYAAGRALSGDGSESGGSARPSAARTTTPDRARSPHAGPTEAEPSTAPGGWAGAVADVEVRAISADCTAPPSNDSAGHRVTYVPENAIDDRADTAWRCAGKAIGQQLTLRMSEDVDVAEVGLVPGYAKTDPASGADRYAENNRITRVRWILGDGDSVVQRLDPDPSSRSVQLLRVPRTTTDTVTLEILGVRRGPRNTTAISQIVVRSAE